jgi:dienelactone hydrolase
MTTGYATLTAFLLLIRASQVPAEETLPPLTAGKAPQTFTEMWAGFDPRKEPLDVEVLKEWEEDGVVLKVLRYRIGVFKGQTAMMAAVYGYPKGAARIPGLVQIHGGGQFAHSNACLTNAKRGYATISIAWAGRLSAPDYTVGKDGVQLFWDEKTRDPGYRLTTDWGALDAYHAPCRNAGNNFLSMKPHPWTLDEVESPRNNPWFLVTLGARRALTFLERQDEVDGDQLGVYGHSMGGKLTVMTAAADSRVKAAAPSCGGISDRRGHTSDLYHTTIADDANLTEIHCPIVFLSPANDFHGTIDDLQLAVHEIGSQEWRVTCSPHHNHQDTSEYEVATQLWFDEVFRKSFSWPGTPGSELTLKTEDGIPRFRVTPDPSKPILSVDVFYTQQGVIPQGRRTGEDLERSIHRFWHHAKPENTGGEWTASLPLLRDDRPLWVYANVQYALEKPVIGAGYYYATWQADRFNVSTLLAMASPKQLNEVSVRPTMSSTLEIEDFKEDWKKEWFIYSNDPQAWQRKTHKVYDEKYKAPESARLTIDVRSQKPNKLIIGLDKTVAEVTIKGGNDWQTNVLSPGDFKDASGNSRESWVGIKEFRLTDQDRLRPERGGQLVKLGTRWQGKSPEFRSLRWVNPVAR